MKNGKICQKNRNLPKKLLLALTRPPDVLVKLREIVCKSENVLQCDFHGSKIVSDDLLELNWKYLTLVVYKLEFDTKSRGRRRKNKKLYYINGGTQERKRSFIKIIFHLRINGGTQERKRSFVKKFLSSLINGGTQV